ncbi:MAG: heme A synthase, partial [Acidimicrobiia bacterium]|nr:heme A synthase [Acidimicrobiia bacterium]
TLVTGSGPHTGSLDEPIDRLPFELRDVARVHSILAWCLLAVAVAVAIGVTRSGRPGDRRRIEVVLGLLVAQGLIGYLQYFTDVPVGLVAVHIVGVVALWWAVVSFHMHRRDTLGAPSTTDRDLVEA